MDRSHKEFRKFVTESSFPCIAGKSAVRSGHYFFREYEDMTGTDTAEAIHADLLSYGRSDVAKSVFSTFVAAFRHPALRDQIHASECYYHLLGNLHACDQRQGYQWCESVSSNVDDKTFAFSISEQAYFVPLFFEHAYAAVRRSPLTFVVFNAMKNLQELRNRNAFQKLKEITRQRQMQAGLTVDPRIGDHGVSCEFPQYTLIDPALVEQERTLMRATIGPSAFDCDKKPTEEAKLFAACAGDNYTL